MRLSEREKEIEREREEEYGEGKKRMKERAEKLGFFESTFTGETTG